MKTATRSVLVCLVALLLPVIPASAAGSDVADAVMHGMKDVLRTLLNQKVDVNVPQVDGTTALHWAVRADDLESADLLLKAGARVSAATRDGATPMQLAALNGSATMIDRSSRPARTCTTLAPTSPSERRCDSFATATSTRASDPAT